MKGSNERRDNAAHCAFRNAGDFDTALPEQIQNKDGVLVGHLVNVRGQVESGAQLIAVKHSRFHVGIADIESQ